MTRNWSFFCLFENGTCAFDVMWTSGVGNLVKMQSGRDTKGQSERFCLLFHVVDLDRKYVFGHGGGGSYGSVGF